MIFRTDFDKVMRERMANAKVAEKSDGDEKLVSKLNTRRRNAHQPQMAIIQLKRLQRCSRWELNM